MLDPPLTIRRNGRALIAERDGAPIAAIALTSGALTGDAHRARRPRAPPPPLPACFRHRG